MSKTLKQGTRLTGRDSAFPDLIVKEMFTFIAPNNFDNRSHYIMFYWDDDDGNRKTRLYHEQVIIDAIRSGHYTIVDIS